MNHAQLFQYLLQNNKINWLVLCDMRHIYEFHVVIRLLILVPIKSHSLIITPRL